MLRPVLKTAPSILPVSVAEIKANARIDHSDDDALVASLAAAAVAHLDGYAGILGRCLIRQTWLQSLACWPAEAVELAFPDVSSVVVTYVATDGQTATLSIGNYRLLAGVSGGRLEWTSAFAAPSLDSRSDAVTVELTAGYGPAAADVPPSLRHAIILLATYWYERRAAADSQAMQEIPFAVSALIAPHRLLRV